MMNIDLLQQVTAFVWMEASMLDHGDYDAWLKLWSDKGQYVVPIDPNETNFEDTLNFAYDNHLMRKKRVDRLRGGRSISTVPSPRTIHQVSRIHIHHSTPDLIRFSCAQDICEFRKQTTRRHAAEVSYELEPCQDSFLIRNKIVRLINATDALTTVGFIF